MCGCGRVGGGYVWVRGNTHAWVGVGGRRGHMFQVVAREFQTVRKYISMHNRNIILLLICRIFNYDQQF